MQSADQSVTWSTIERARTRGTVVPIIAVTLGVVSVPSGITRAQVTPAGQPTVGQPPETLVARAGSGRWDTFSTEVTVRRRLVAADGRQTGPTPTMERFRWERSKTANGWKTTTTVTHASRPTVRSRNGVVALEAPPTIAKMEDLEDGSMPRLWDTRGVEIKPPAPGFGERLGLSRPGPLPLVDDQARASGGTRAGRGSDRSWIDGFVMPAAGRGRRRAAIEREFGRPLGVTRGVGRYMRRSGDIEREVLVDEQEGVTIGTNATDKGELIERSAFAYDRTASGALVKRGLRLERLASATDQTLMVTEVEYSDIRLSPAGGR